MASKIRRTLTIGHMPDGRPIKKNFCGKTKKEVNKKIDDYKIRAATGQLELKEGIPLSIWAEEWLVRLGCACAEERLSTVFNTKKIPQPKPGGKV